MPTNANGSAPRDKKPRGPARLLNKKTVEKALVNLQRGANDAAVLELHRRESGKLPARVLVNALGQLFYRAGTQTEYLFVWVLRFARALALGLWHAAQGLAAAFALPAAHFFSTMWRDLSAPWRRMLRGAQNARAAMREEQLAGGEASAAGAAYVRRGVRANRHLLAAALNWLLPVGAAAVMAFTVYSVMHNGFSLRVTYNGEVIGFVESDTVWDSAVQIVNSRIVAADGGEEMAWGSEPEFTIVPVDPAARSSASRMADTLITNSSDKIQNATGIYVDDALIGVSDDGAALQDALNEVLAPYQSDDPNHRVAFAHNVQLVSGVYYTSSVRSTSDVLASLNAVPDYLQIQTIDVEEYDEEIPVETIEQESDQYYEGVRRTIQRGSAGTQHVVAEVTRINGEEVSRVPLQTTVIEEMTPTIVAVGTLERTTSFIGQVGSGQWTFPVPGYTGMGTYAGHRGYDFQAPYGSPIYACDGGTVVNAERHWSWGNYVRIDHHNGLYSLYAHCSSLAVSVGQTVGRGQLIGYVGQTGTASGNHLHLEVWTDPSGARWCLANPLSYVTPP